MNTLISIETTPEDHFQLSRQANADLGLTRRPASNDAIANNWYRETIAQTDRERFRHRAILVLAGIVCVLLIGFSINYYVIG